MTVAVIILASRFITAPLLASPGIVPFLVCVVLITALFNAVFLLLFGRTQEMRYLKGLLKNRLSKGEKCLLDLLSDEAARQLRELPRQDAAGTFRRLVKKALGRQMPKKDDLFWPAGLLLLGLWEAGRRENVEAYVRAWMAKNAQVSYVDDALAGYVILCLYEQTKDPQFKEAADRIREFLEDTRQ